MAGIRVNFKKIGPTEFISICMKVWRLIMLDDLFCLLCGLYLINARIKYCFQKPVCETYDKNLLL